MRKGKTGTFGLMQNEQPTQDGPPPTGEKKPWPLSWVLIAILLYVLLQVFYFLFIS